MESKPEESVFANKAFLFIIVTIFLSVMGIGIVMPVIPFLVQSYVPASQLSWYVGALVSLYAVCQFFAGPVLGAASDSLGRRPILLLCQLGSAIGYVIFGLAGSLWLLFLGRAIDGITGGDFSTAAAYVADVTEPKSRAKYFGVIGATAGLGFILGPSLGGLLSLISLKAPFYVAAGITLLTMVYGYFFLPESLKQENRSGDFSWTHLNPLTPLSHVFDNPRLRTILTLGLFYYLAFSIMSSISSIFFKDTLHWTAANIGLYLLVVGVGDMITQGYLAGKLASKFGARRLVLAGFLVTGTAFVLNALLPAFPFLAIACIYIVVYAFGSGLFEPAYGGMISEIALPNEQGRVQGASQSVQALTRIVGPLLAAFLYQIGYSWPWILCVGLSLAGALILLKQKEGSHGHNFTDSEAAH